VSTHCRYHCRTCGSHFTSLRAFDAHRGDGCDFPVDLIEHAGICRISEFTDNAEPITKTATIYEHPDADRARTAFRP
jgi:hypothetical protein